MPGLFDWLTGASPAGVAGEAVSATLGGIGDAAIKIRTAITGKDPALEAQIQLHLADIDLKLSEAQNEVNKAEASSGNMFVAGARPAAMWVCVIGLAYSFLIQPFLAWASINFKWLPPPIIDSGQLMALITGMMGLGTMRTVEKIKDVQGSH